ncbi:uncharacterized protein [Macaca nemestrina]|uniref:uncharacterized protein isoform X1 n=1 Tax=Macaca nemestrina TaxID=9545 RepID=UPI0039B98642
MISSSRYAPRLREKDRQTEDGKKAGLGGVRRRRAPWADGGRDGQHHGQLPPLAPGAEAPTAAARSPSTMHRCARGHRGGGRRRVNPRSVHPSFLCQLGGAHRCSESKALPPLSRDEEGRKRKRGKAATRCKSADGQDEVCARQDGVLPFCQVSPVILHSVFFIPWEMAAYRKPVFCSASLCESYQRERNKSSDFLCCL